MVFFKLSYSVTDTTPASLSLCHLANGYSSSLLTDIPFVGDTLEMVKIPTRSAGGCVRALC